MIQIELTNEQGKVLQQFFRGRATGLGKVAAQLGFCKGTQHAELSFAGDLIAALQVQPSDTEDPEEGPETAAERLISFVEVGPLVATAEDEPQEIIQLLRSRKELANSWKYSYASGMVEITCAEGHRGQLPDVCEIHDSGKLTPAVGCSVDGCGWVGRLTLVEWPLLVEEMNKPKARQGVQTAAKAKTDHPLKAKTKAKAEPSKNKGGTAEESPELGSKNKESLDSLLGDM